MKPRVSDVLTIRKSEERGFFDHGWLKTHHSFSFAGYRDPAHMGFRALRVINEDWVASGRGFGTHPHENMEILTYVIEGKLAHKDSMGNGATIHPGEVQRMSAGTGITHSEYNPSNDDPAHFLQIWIEPEREGLSPGYEQKLFAREEKLNRRRLIVSRDGREGSVILHQDVAIYASVLEAGLAMTFEPGQGRHTWLQVIDGALEVNGLKFSAGDGAATSCSDPLEIYSNKECEFLLFDLG